MKKTKFQQILLVLFVGLMIVCTEDGSFTQKGWNLIFDSRGEKFTITYENLGVILADARLNVNDEGNLVPLSGWTLEKKDNQMVTITTNQPVETTWTFVISEEGVDINCSDDNAVVSGQANADGSRIPARIASQDNGVIYTSLGYVSAKNIYCLFDRLTDSMIQFPQNSDFVRNASDERIMDVTFPLIPSWGRREGRTRTRRGEKTAPTVEILVIPNYYTGTLGIKVYNPYWPQYPDKSPFQKAPTGWLSWYAYYMPCNEEDMVTETDALARDLKQYGLDYVQLDATFTRGAEANWLEWDKEKFPRGGKWLMQYIKEKGLKPGLWVNVYGANYPKPDFGHNFPDGKYPENFFLHDKNGRHMRACCTADSTVVKLDFSNPEVTEKHLKPLFRTLFNEWGIEYLKDAGHARWQWSYEENRERVFNPSLEGRDLYWEVQKVLREIMGPTNFLMGCDAEGGSDYYSGGFGIFDSAFDILSDVYNVWESRGRRGRGGARGTTMHLATLFSANYLNDIVLYNDPDATMARPPLTLDEAINNITSISLTGQAYMTSDFMAQPSEERIQVLSQRGWGREFPQLIKKLPVERLDLYRKTMPAMDITPIDLYPYRSKAEYAPLIDGYPEKENFPKALDLKVNSKTGIYDVVAVYNWADYTDEKEISLDDLGLDTTKAYLAFDFWDQELLGTFDRSVQCNVPAHGAKVLIIRAISETPQLLATSRHITGAFSIEELKWDSGESALSGTSRTVAGDPYSLFVHVPAGLTVSDVETNASALSHTTGTDGILEVRVQGQDSPVKWTITFKRGV